jgi:hypothetical protein
VYVYLAPHFLGRGLGSRGRQGSNDTDRSEGERLSQQVTENVHVGGRSSCLARLTLTFCGTDPVTRDSRWERSA